MKNYIKIIFAMIICLPVLLIFTACDNQDTTEETEVYSIQYDLNGGINNPNNVFSYTCEDEIVLYSPSRNGYTFCGWYIDSIFAVSINSISKGAKGNIKLYAKWQENQYYINYHLDGGTNNNPTYYTIESNFYLSDAVKQGYTFDGWYADSEYHNKTEKISKGTMGNLELYAKFSINQYTLSFESNGGSSVSSITDYFGTTIIKPDSPTKAGYQFVDWYTDNNFNTKFSFNKMPASNTKLYARWTNALAMINEDEITSISNFIDVLSNSNSWSKKIKLYSNIDLNNCNWTPIGSFEHCFTGEFDGNGYVISNFRINTESVCAGFFGMISNAKISNLGIENISINFSLTNLDSVTAGALIGRIEYSAQVDCCFTTGSIQIQALSSSVSNICAGGLIGCANAHSNTSNISIKNCYSNVNIELSNNSASYSSFAGGFIGQTFRTMGKVDIFNSYSTGSVSAQSTSSDCGKAYAGGFVAYDASGSYHYCYSTSNVSAQSSIINNSYGSAFIANATGTSYDTCYCDEEQSVLADNLIDSSWMEKNKLYILQFVINNWDENLWLFSETNNPLLKIFTKD